MSCLLDTHYLLWSLFHPGRISEAALKILGDPDSVKAVSSVSFWEISLKYSLGKLSFAGILPEQIYTKSIEAGYLIINVENSDFLTFYHLPVKESHKDPFDRLLIWQAIRHDYTIITADRKFNHYSEDGLTLLPAP